MCQSVGEKLHQDSWTFHKGEVFRNQPDLEHARTCLQGKGRDIYVIPLCRSRTVKGSLWIFEGAL